MITKRDGSVATFLRSVPVFHDLKGPSLDVLFDYLEERKWEVGEHICNEGELGRTLYVIREGEVEVLLAPGVQRGLTVGEGDDVVPPGGETQANEVAHRLVGVGDEDACHAISWIREAGVRRAGASSAQREGYPRGYASKRGLPILTLGR